MNDKKIEISEKVLDRILHDLIILHLRQREMERREKDREWIRKVFSESKSN